MKNPSLLVTFTIHYLFKSTQQQISECESHLANVMFEEWTEVKDAEGEPH